MNANSSNPKTNWQSRSRASWIFGLLLLGFSTWVFMFAPETLPEYKHRMLGIFLALLSGLFTFFLTGDLGLEIQSIKSRFGELSVRATGGIGIFILVLVWWWSPSSPIEVERKLSPIRQGTERILERLQKEFLFADQKTLLNLDLAEQVRIAARIRGLKVIRDEAAVFIQSRIKSWAVREHKYLGIERAKALASTLLDIAVKQRDVTLENTRNGIETIIIGRLDLGLLDKNIQMLMINSTILTIAERIQKQEEDQLEKFDALQNKIISLSEPVGIETTNILIQDLKQITQQLLATELDQQELIQRAMGRYPEPEQPFPQARQPEQPLPRSIGSAHKYDDDRLKEGGLEDQNFVQTSPTFNMNRESQGITGLQYQGRGDCYESVRLLKVRGFAPGLGATWKPQKPIEFVIPAGPGGGADVMARFIAPLVSKYNLSPHPVVVVNKAGGAGAEGFLYVKGKKGDPHVIIITLSNLFTTPLATGAPFSWTDFTPVARLALDEFVLWVNAESPYTTAAAYMQAAKDHPGTFKMGGTGTAQEDQIITVQLEQATGAKFIYVPFRGGGDVATNLVGKHVDSTVNNPNEAVSHWKAGRLRPLGIFDLERLELPDWQNIPTMKEQGYDIEYLMLRGIFGAPDLPKEAQDWYIELLKKVSETPEWIEFTDKGGLKRAFLTDQDFIAWLECAEALHKDLMHKGDLVKR